MLFKQVSGSRVNAEMTNTMKFGENRDKLEKNFPLGIWLKQLRFCEFILH